VFGATVTAEHQITIDRGVRIPMRDGVGLIADVYRPSPEGRYPVLLQRTPYDRSSNTNAMLMLNPVRAATAGFAVVVQDTRGRFESEGDFEPFLADIADGYDTVEWCAGQSWSNERVGMYGMSYVGATQWLAAIAHPPHLMAIAPQLTSSSFNDGWLRHDGVLALGFAGSWMLGNLAPDTFRRLRARDPKYGPAMRRALATLDELGTWLRTTPFEDTCSTTSHRTFGTGSSRVPTPTTSPPRSGRRVPSSRRYRHSSLVGGTTRSSRARLRVIHGPGRRPTRPTLDW
jgi:putative CocE/NonD family hydrolase